MTIYILDVLLSQFGTSPLFHVCSNYCFSTCLQVSQETGNISLRIFRSFLVIHTVESFSVVNEAEVDFFFV